MLETILVGLAILSLLLLSIMTLLVLVSARVDAQNEWEHGDGYDNGHGRFFGGLYDHVFVTSLRNRMRNEERTREMRRRLR